jgi:hypothetical protein
MIGDPQISKNTLIRAYFPEKLECMLIMYAMKFEDHLSFSMTIFHQYGTPEAADKILSGAQDEFNIRVPPACLHIIQNYKMVWFYRIPMRTGICEDYLNRKKYHQFKRSKKIPKLVQ